VSLDELAGEFRRDFFTPLGLHANELGRMYAIAYALLLFIWSESRNPRLSVPLLASMGVLVVALVLTFSRGSFVAFILVNLIFMLWRGSARTVMVGIIGAIALMVLLPGAVLVRMQLGLGTVDFNALTAGRVDHIWLPLVPELWRSPLWGNGLGSIMWMPPMRAGHMFTVGHPHNAYLQALLDMGVVGLALVCAYWLHVWRGLRKLGRDASLAPELRGLYQGAAAALAAMAIANMAGSSLLPVPEQCLLWMAVGMMYGQRLRQPGS
jgi:O-antigen ligase